MKGRREAAVIEAFSARFCAICGDHDRKTLFKQRFEAVSAVSLMKGYDVVTCGGCGFVYADYIPPTGTFERYYAEASKYEYSHRGGEQHEAEQRRLSLLAERLAKQLQTSARVLDVGCATGELLSALRRLGFSNLTGLDPSAACAAYARAVHGLPVFNHALRPRPVGVPAFQAIILSAVLEHVPDLHGFLKLIDEWLIPDGFLIIEVPDAENFVRGFNAPYQEFSVEHINFFSAPALDNLLGLRGYEKVAKYQDLCSVGGDLTSPVLTAFYRRSADSKSPIKESVSENAVLAYLASCKAAIETEQGVIAELVESQRPVVVWGVGTLCQRLLASTRLKEANITSFVDSNPHYQGRTLAGRQVVAPTALCGRSEPILVLSWGFLKEITNQIREELKLKNEIMRIDGPRSPIRATTYPS